MIYVHNGMPRVSLEKAVFFPFDDYSIPLRVGLFPKLIGGKRFDWTQPIVVRNGLPGSHDEMIFYYGTVLQLGDQLRMWYIGWNGDPQSQFFERQYPGKGTGRICYATSKDGIEWEKPELNFIEYKGSKRNNIIDFREDAAQVTSMAIIHDPEEANPDRRFKMTYQSTVHERSRMAVAFSPDGLHWKDAPSNPVAPKLEMSGLIKFGNCYFVNGQGGYGTADFPGRKFQTMVSYDFEKWRHGAVHSMPRIPSPGSPWKLEEVHLGAGLHDRGNVILGVYGMWHFPWSEDRRQVVVDLGLCVSNDGMHFREPIPNFKLVAAAEERETLIGFGPALSQGQGMAHLGNKTYYYYGNWPGGGHIRMATWERDRFGCFGFRLPSDAARCITCPFTVEGNDACVHLNIDGLGPHTTAVVEVLTERLELLPEFSNENALPLTDNGIRVPVRWKNGVTLPKGHPIRLKISLGGLRLEDSRLYAIYVGTESAALVR